MCRRQSKIDLAAQRLRTEPDLEARVERLSPVGGQDAQHFLDLGIDRKPQIAGQLLDILDQRLTTTQHGQEGVVEQLDLPVCGQDDGGRR